MAQGGVGRRLRFALESSESRKWKQIFVKFADYNNEHCGGKGVGVGRREVKEEKKKDSEKLERQNQGKTQGRKWQYKPEKREGRTEKRKRNPKKTEPASSVSLTRWINTDFKRRGNCSRSPSSVPEPGFSDPHPRSAREGTRGAGEARTRAGLELMPQGIAVEPSLPPQARALFGARPGGALRGPLPCLGRGVSRELKGERRHISPLPVIFRFFLGRSRFSQPRAASRGAPFSGPHRQVRSDLRAAPDGCRFNHRLRAQAPGGDNDPCQGDQTPTRGDGGVY